MKGSVAEALHDAPGTAAIPFRDGREHLEAALGLLDLRLRRLVLEQRQDPGIVDFHELRGHYVSDEEVDLLGRAFAGELESSAPKMDLRALRKVEERSRQRFAARLRASVEGGGYLPLVELAQRFDLTPFELDAVLLCLAPELDLRYETLYAYLHDNVHRKRPTVGLVLRFTGAPAAARGRLASTAPLLTHELLAYDERSADEPVFLARSLVIDEAVVDFLLELSLPDPQLAGRAELERASCGLEAPVADLASLGEAEAGFLRILTRRLAEGRPHFVLVATPDADADHMARRLTCAAGHELLLRVDGRDLRDGGPELWKRWMRHARLHAAGLMAEAAAALLAKARWQADFSRALAEFPHPVFLICDRPWPAGDLCQLNLETPTAEARRARWRVAAESIGVELEDDVDLAAFADRYPFSRRQMRQALEAARDEGLSRDLGLDSSLLHRACRAAHGPRLEALGQRVPVRHTWGDLVLAADQLAHLREVCAHIRHHGKVFGTWGLGRRIPHGQGVSVLLVGPPGTGKTMAAEILAGELELELFKIDLAGVVSKYIGETEKNLSGIFDAAAASPVLLFFDEADALFGKRTEVKDAHDRYANLEINYLLQRLEQHPGPVILASNLRKNIDEAFVRRLRFIIELPMPGEAERRSIWHQFLDSGVPCAEDLDVEFLARRFPLSGGSIRNVVLSAAFLAADADRPLAMIDLVRAVRREQGKSGRLCVRADFEHYFDLLPEGAWR